MWILLNLEYLENLSYAVQERFPKSKCLLFYFGQGTYSSQKTVTTMHFFQSSTWLKVDRHDASHDTFGCSTWSTFFCIMWVGLHGKKHYLPTNFAADNISTASICKLKLNEETATKLKITSS